MTAPRYAAIAATLIRDSVSRAEADAPSAKARAAGIAAIEIALETRRTRARRRRIVASLSLGAAIAAAAAVAFFSATSLPPAAPQLATTPAAPTFVAPRDVAASTITMVAHPTGGGATLEVAGQAGPLMDGARLAEGSRVVTRADGGVMLGLSTGTKLTLSDGAQLTVDGDRSTQVFSLGAGAVRAEVAKLTAEQRFLVRTVDTEVEVRGTVFQVSRLSDEAYARSRSCGATASRVVVSEGVVVVRHAGSETKVAAGESWPPGCNANGEGTALAAHAVAPSRVAAARDSNDPAAASEANQPSRLAEENDLFARAVAAHRRGADADAVRDFDTLIRRYPGGPLAETATVEKMRALRAVDRARASSAAQDYLRRYPNGFARAEAEANR